MKEIPLTPSPEVGAVFRNGIDGKCTVSDVWKSRFGDWKVSYHTEKGGGGMMGLDYFNETVAIRHAEETPCGPMCSIDDHRRYASRGRCALCGSSFYPPNATCPSTGATEMKS